MIAQGPHLSDVVKSVPECIKIVARDGALLDMTPVGLAMLQAETLADAQAKPLIEFVDPKDRAAFTALHNQVFSGRAGRLIFDVIGLKGLRRTLETYAVPLRDELGTVVNLLGSTRDVTERRREVGLLNTLKMAVEDAADGMAIYSADAKFVYANRAHAHMFGYAHPAELIGKSWKFHYDETQIRRYVQEAWPELTRSGHWQGEVTAIKRDGSTFEQGLTLSLLEDGGLICISRDITEALEAQRARALLAAVVEQTEDAVISHTPEGIVTSWNRGAEQLSGYSESEAVGRSIMSLMPVDQHLDEQYMLSVVRGGESATHQKVLRVRKDGSQMYLSITVSPIKDGAGRVVGVSRIARDISQRHYAEEALFREKEQAEVTLKSIGDAVITTDLSGCITYLNPVSETMTGWSNSQARGKALPEVFRIVDGATHATAPDPMLVALRENRRTGLATNTILLARNGREIAIEDSASPIHDREGRVVGGVLIFRDVSETYAMALRMTHQAQHDFLTGLPNRVLLIDRLTQAIALARRNATKVALLFVDLDRFKQINDSLGHEAGDELLTMVGVRLKACVREIDTVCRQGGDEFVVLLGAVSETQHVGQIAEKILATCAQPYLIGGCEAHIGASIGISVFPEDGSDADTLTRNADAAMYHAKQLGRQNFQFYTAEMNARAQEHFVLETDLRRALREEELVLYYQPLYALHDSSAEKLIGCEALLRWQHPQRGLVPPGDFLPLIEDSALNVPLNQWVLREACRQNQAWRAAGLNPPPVSVNLSAAQFKRRDFLQSVREILVQTGLEPHLLNLELTENIVMHDADGNVELLRNLKAMGVRISIDDFGIGYSSFSHLRRLPIDVLKIDQSFVRDLPADTECAEIISAIIGIGKTLRYHVVAEGVETSEQLEFLRARGCDAVQGYYYSQPLPAADFAQRLISAPIQKP
jgi:diguanylate cyclase (GGDEF)-like protein/PAS domain S-box-containing protein